MPNGGVFVERVRRADEFGFATAPLVASGCIMMRKCHLNTCPVGIATQDPVLRRKFNGKPEHVVNYFFFVAEEARKIMSEMGVRRLDEIIGRADLLNKNPAIRHWKADGLDFSKMFHRPNSGEGPGEGPGEGNDIYNSTIQQHDLADVLDRKLLAQAKGALDKHKFVLIEEKIANTDRSTGALLSGRIAEKYGHAGLPDGMIHLKLTGTAGQSFGAFVAKGVTLELSGEANDYVAKGLSGGRLVDWTSPRCSIGLTLGRAPGRAPGRAMTSITVPSSSMIWRMFWIGNCWRRPKEHWISINSS